MRDVREEKAVPGGRRLPFEIEWKGERVPGVLLVPTSDAPVPAALLLHGYTSRKERMAETIGHALLACGVASLAIDLPLHGERVAPLGPQSVSNPLEIVHRWNAAIAESLQAIAELAARPEVDGARVGLVGYSLGSYLGTIVAARAPAVRAVVLAAGGDLPANTPFATLVRTFADPIRAVGTLAGRPLLMMHGRRDRTVTPEQAERLFAAAGEPKELKWWDAGHWLPSDAIA